MSNRSFLSHLSGEEVGWCVEIDMAAFLSHLSGEEDKECVMSKSFTVSKSPER